MLDLQDMPSDSQLSATGRIIETICRGILCGKLRVGDKLPSRLELAKQLGVNATTVGHAYRRLEARGVLESRRGSGTYVCSCDRELMTMSRARRLKSICMVIGGENEIGRPYNLLRVVIDVVAGIRSVLGNDFPVTFKESFTQDCLGGLGQDTAVLLVHACACEPQMLTTLRQRDIPVLKIWNGTPDVAASAIVYSPLEAVGLACDHLIQCGYRRIGYIGVMGGRSGRTDIAPKFLAFTNTLFRANMDYQVRHVREVDSTFPGSASLAVMDIIQNGDLPDAFFVDTDSKAIEVVTVLARAGIKVPQDIGVMGYNDIPEAALCTPPLSTIRLPRYEAGEYAARLLQRWQQGENDLPSVALEPKLVVRESTLSGQSRKEPVKRGEASTDSKTVQRPST